VLFCVGSSLFTRFCLLGVKTEKQGTSPMKNKDVMGNFHLGHRSQIAPPLVMTDQGTETVYSNLDVVYLVSFTAYITVKFICFTVDATI